MIKINWAKITGILLSSDSTTSTMALIDTMNTIAIAQSMHIYCDNGACGYCEELANNHIVKIYSEVAEMFGFICKGSIQYDNIYAKLFGYGRNTIVLRAGRVYSKDGFSDKFYNDEIEFEIYNPELCNE